MTIKDSLSRSEIFGPYPGLSERLDAMDGMVNGLIVAGGGAVAFDPTPGVQSDQGIVANWLSGKTPTSGGGVFQIALGDPTALCAGDYCTVLGGFGNSVAGVDSTVIGGFGNAIVTSLSSDILGGSSNIVTGHGSTIVGGISNFIDASNSQILGGQIGTIVGASTMTSVIVGGQGGGISGDSARCVVIAGDGNTVSESSNSGVFAGGSNSVTGPTTYSSFSAIVAGESNTLTSVTHSAIIAGDSNSVSGDRTVIAGGSGSVASDTDSFVCGSASATVGTARTFAHGLTLADAVAFRGLTPVPAPILSPLLPTGTPGLDAAITALISQGLAA